MRMEISDQNEGYEPDKPDIIILIGVLRVVERHHYFCLKVTLSYLHANLFRYLYGNAQPCKLQPLGQKSTNGIRLPNTSCDD